MLSIQDLHVSIGDKEIITVNAALGSRPSEISRQWAKAPDVPAPQDCRPVHYLERQRPPAVAHEASLQPEAKRQAKREENQAN